MLTPCDDCPSETPETGLPTSAHDRSGEAAVPGADHPAGRAVPDWLADMPADIRAIYRYWDEKRGARLMPSRADLDPVDLVAYLPNILLVDVVPDERLYVYRLVGTREVFLRGSDPTGKPVLDNSFQGSDEARRNYDLVVLSRAPHVDATPALSDDREWLDLETIFLPLGESDAEVDKILVYAVQKRVELPQLP